MAESSNPTQILSQEEHIQKQEPNTKQQARPPSPNPFELAPQVEFNFDEISFNANNEAALLYPSHLKSEYFKRLETASQDTRDTVTFHPTMALQDLVTAS
ncbi:hypothetical protein Tco_1165460 [Tanacetum coccineum]